MKLIDQATVQRILDAADIVEVVSDFVSLKRRGANYIGLCPFHNERTPSFSVSRSKGICKCFSCGKGGSPVNFIMEHEQMTFNEALRYLARKYNIEIVEQELTEEQREKERDRENMFAVNEWAMRHFETNLTDTTDGRDIGLSYFRHRSISDEMIKKFHLGYALEKADALSTAAKESGFSEKYLVETGLCSRTDRGTLYDRFRGRVIYPVLTLSGKVVAFGGRTLKTDKSVAKYVNSPESEIYLKRKVLYGLYQAKQTIVKKDHCYLVEGYMDVISMYQAGVTNVVASSGTSLTTDQVALIHRFTPNVTVIYDSDAAGIKASLRGIDMLLHEGMNVKVVQFPEGEDPDSYARAHSSSEVEEYLATHSTDFIRFKTRILMDGVENDPVGRSEAITDIVRSVAQIPDEIKRNIYVQECAVTFNIDEKVLQRQVAKHYEQQREKDFHDAQKEAVKALPVDQQPQPAVQAGQSRPVTPAAPKDEGAFLRPYEMGVLKLAVKYGLLPFCESTGADGQAMTLTVLQYVTDELSADSISFVNPDCNAVMTEITRLASTRWPDDYAAKYARLQDDRAREYEEGVRHIRATATDIGSITAMENQLNEKIDKDFNDRLDAFAVDYLAQTLLSHPDEAMRRLAGELVIEKYQLSKVHTKFSHIETEQEQLLDLVPRKLFELKDAILYLRLRAVKDKIARAAGGDFVSIMELLTRQKEIEDLRKELAKLIGDRVIAPRR